MVKKIFDILPPESFSPPKEKKKKREVSFSSSKLRLNQPRLKKTLIFIFSSLILVGIFCYFTLSKAEIEIWPESEVSSYETSLRIDGKIKEVNFSDKIIPGEIFEAEDSLSQEFPSSGKVLKKAEGKIRLYNKYTTKAETWREGTRFISAKGGKIFKSKSKIFVPGAKLKKEKLEPSFTDVDVVAAEPGKSYNIGPTKFAVYVYRGTARYTKYWGESSQAMAGGGEVSQVTQEDLDRAQKVLIKKAENKILISLKSKIPSDYNLLDGAIEKKTLKSFCSATKGQELKRFNCQVKMIADGLGFKQEDIENFAKHFILAQVPKDKELYQPSLKIDYSLKEVDIKSSKVNLNLVLAAKIYSKIDKTALKEGLGGRTLTEARFFLENQPRISKVEIKLWPFWVKKIPGDTEKIKIKLNL